MATATLDACFGSATVKARGAMASRYADAAGNPWMTPSLHRYVDTSLPSTRRAASLRTPRPTITHTLPAPSEPISRAEPLRSGVLSTGWPPAAGTVHRWSGVSTDVVVLRNAMVWP